MKFFTKITTFALSLLGFSACNVNSGLVMYGQPTAYFKINVTVADKATGQGVQNAQVIVKRTISYNVGNPHCDTLNVDQNGIANAKLYMLGASDMDVTVVAQDKEIQSSEQKIYQKDSVKFKVEHTEFKGGDGQWYDGEATKDVTIKLEKEK